MIEIINNNILYEGKMYSILEIEEHVVHLIDTFGNGICVEITEQERNNLMEYMNQ